MKMKEDLKKIQSGCEGMCSMIETSLDIIRLVKLEDNETNELSSVDRDAIYDLESLLQEAYGELKKVGVLKF